MLNARGGAHLKRFDITAGVDNLLNRYYYEFFSFQRDPFRTGSKVPEPGRSLYVNAAVRF